MNARAILLMVFLSGCPTPRVPDAGEVGDAGSLSPGDSCEAAIELVLPEDGGELVFNGDATGFADHLSCEAPQFGGPIGVGPDVVFRIVNGARGLSAVSSGGAMHLKAECPSTLCVARGSSYLPVGLRVVHELATQELFLTAEASGPFVLRVRGTNPARGDTCNDALPVPLDGGVGVVSADFTQYFYSGSHSFPDCQNGRSMEVPDLALAVPIAVPSRLHARLSKDGGVGARLIWQDQFCELRCFSGGADDIDTGELDAGTYFIAVAATDRAWDPQPFEVEVDVTTLAQGDSCANPIALVVMTDGGSERASIAGDTSGATSSELGASCGEASRDLTYVLTLTQRRDLSATVTATTGSFRPALALRASCASSPGACAMASFPGAGAQLSATGLPPGDYLFTVGAAPDGGSGAFSLDVTLTP